MELVARDFEHAMGIRLPLASDFRVDLDAYPDPDVWRERTPGSFENFVSYIDRKGLGEGQFTVVDNGLRGSAQEIMTHALGKEINGHYAFLSISPNDPNPRAKKGHVFHLPASEWQGGNARTLPDDPRLTFLHTRSLWVIESLMPGPAQSAVAIERRGPVQTLPDLLPSRMKFPGPLDGAYREPGVEKYWEPGVEEASRVSILLAATHHAQSGSPGNLDNFTDQLRKWLQRDESRDPDLARLTSALSLYNAH
ncbi:hypothetical protein [Nocardia sp. NPDC049149]|uniref:hypothetical protein n=1 Tax=Nocardia sp. NPDC049149 TaxID=3364315 RepID=UPI003710A6B1